MKADIIKQIIKILLSPLNVSIREIADILEKFLEANQFLKSNNLEQEKVIINPLSLNRVNDNEIWNLETLVKEFLNLKDNLLAYKQIGNLKQQSYLNLENKNKQFTFKPEITNNYKTNSELVQMDFENRTKKFIEKKQLKNKQREKEIQENVRRKFLL